MKRVQFLAHRSTKGEIERLLSHETMYYLHTFLMWQKLIDDVVSNFACSTYISMKKKKRGQMSLQTNFVKCCMTFAISHSALLTSRTIEISSRLAESCYLLSFKTSIKRRIVNQSLDFQLKLLLII